MTHENIAENQFVITRKRVGELLFLMPESKYAVWTNDIQKARIFTASEVQNQELFEDESVFPISDFDYVPFNRKQNNTKEGIQMKNNHEKENVIKLEDAPKTNWADTLPPHVTLDGFVCTPSDSHGETALEQIRKGILEEIEGMSISELFEQMGKYTSDYIHVLDNTSENTQLEHLKCFSNKPKHMRAGEAPELNFQNIGDVPFNRLELECLYTGSLETFGFDK